MIINYLEFKEMPKASSNYKFKHLGNSSEYKDLVKGTGIINNLFKKKNNGWSEEIIALIEELTNCTEGKFIVFLHADIGGRGMFYLNNQLSVDNILLLSCTRRTTSACLRVQIKPETTLDNITKGIQDAFNNLDNEKCNYVTDIFKTKFESFLIDNSKSATKINPLNDVDKKYYIEATFDISKEKKVQIENIEFDLPKEYIEPHQIDANHLKPILCNTGYDLIPEEYDEAYDSRYLFYDSCIWFRFNPDNFITGDNDKIQLKSAIIQEFKRDENWFKLAPSIEFRAFQKRLYNSSYIRSIAKSHNDYVTPFKFHSETSCYLRSETMVKEDLPHLLKGNATWIWNILIIDDYGNESFDVKDSDLTKKNRIIQVLDLQKNGERYEMKNTIGKTVEFCIKVLDHIPEDSNDKEYLLWADIILFDYLFKQEKGEPYKKSDEVISMLYEGEFEGVSDKRHWIIPISAYNFAFIDKLKLRHVGHYNKHVVISDGGDPICQPHLFRMRFLEMLITRLREYLDENNKKNVLDLIKDIGAQDKDDISNYARNRYNEIFSLLQTYKNLINSVQHKGLAKSILKNYFFDSGREDLTESEIDVLNRFIYLVGHELGSSQWILKNIKEITEKRTALADFYNKIYDKLFL